jgi:hypothetical protein
MADPSLDSINSKLDEAEDCIEYLRSSLRSDEKEGSAWRMRYLYLIKKSKSEISDHLNDIGNAIKDKKPIKSEQKDNYDTNEDR